VKGATPMWTMSRFLSFAVLIAAVCACSHTESGSFAPDSSRLIPPVAPKAKATPGPAGKIEHIIFVIQENRTVDNLFGGPHPFPGADAVSQGATSSGKPKKLGKVYFFPSLDVDNYHSDFLIACNAPSGPPFTVGQPSPCRMNGFDKNQSLIGGNIYSYVDYSETKPYWDIASKYTLGDHFFMSHNSESYTAHQYLFSGQSNNVIQAPNFPGWFNLPFITPWGCDSPKGSSTYLLNPNTGVQTPKPTGPFPCFNYPSLADLLNAKGLSWRLYAWSIHENVNALDVNRSIRYSKYWDNGVNFRTTETQFLKDVNDPTLPLANVTWILPGPTNSDHPGTPSLYGPSWVASIVNAVGKSKYWNNTVIFITWDDWGGFYDHVPPYVVRDQFGPGVRVPLLVVSPYAKRGYVAKTNTEFGTLLAFAEQTFNLGNLGAVDTSPYIHNFNDFFDWTSPQPFRPVTGDKPASFFENLDEGRILRMSPGDSTFWSGSEDDD
jgi:phospholipase C